MCLYGKKGCFRSGKLGYKLRKCFCQCKAIKMIALKLNLLPQQHTSATQLSSSVFHPVLVVVRVRTNSYPFSCQKQESSLDLVTGMLCVFHVDACVLLYSRLNISFITLFIVMNFSISPEILLEPFLGSTPNRELVITKRVYKNYPIIVLLQGHRNIFDRIRDD